LAFILSFAGPLNCMVVEYAWCCSFPNGILP
jgi:hypothetical protein